MSCSGPGRARATGLACQGQVGLASASPTLDLGLAGSLDLRMIGAFAPDIAASGRLVLGVKATGSLADPALAGQIAIAQASAIMRAPRMAVSDVTGTVAFSGDEIRVSQVSGHANGGTIDVDGTLQYRNLALTGGSLAIRGRGLALEIPENLRTEVDADLALGADRGAPLLTGKVTILRGGYLEPISLAEAILGGGAPSFSAASIGGGTPGPLDGLRLGVSIVTAEDLVVDNNYARGAIAGTVRVTGTVGQPALGGRLTAREGGQVYLGGRIYQVQHGTVNFTNPTRIEPDLDLSLETHVQNYDVTLAITGTPDKLNVSLSSPGVSEQDAVSLLLTGQLARESTVAQTDVARGQLLMLLSGEFLGRAGRTVGLESVQVSQGLGAAASDFDLLSTNTDPSARLTLAKRLRSNVELIYSQSLTATGDITWVVSYRPVPAVELRATNEDNNSRVYEFRHELTFGRSPGAAALAPPAQSAGQHARIAAVRFTGSPGESERDLAKLVRLHAGDAFDFYRWQNDRDRIVGVVPRSRLPRSPRGRQSPDARGGRRRCRPRLPDRARSADAPRDRGIQRVG